MLRDKYTLILSRVAHKTMLQIKNSRIWTFLQKYETVLHLHYSGLCCCAIWWLLVCNADAGKNTHQNPNPLLFQAFSHIFPLWSLIFYFFFFFTLPVSSGNRASMRMSYINRKVSAIFANTGYLGHQEEAGTDNKQQKTYDLLRSKSNSLHLTAGYLRMPIHGLLRWHVMKDNTYI